MHASEIIFSVVMILAAISFVAALCMLLYYKRTNFELKGEMTRPELAKKLATISVGINVSVVISIAASIVSAIIPPLAFMGVFIVFALCGASIIIGPGVSLLGIVFSVISVKRDAEGNSKYIWASGLSMLFSLYIMVSYIQMIVP